MEKSSMDADTLQSTAAPKAPLFDASGVKKVLIGCFQDDYST